MHISAPAMYVLSATLSRLASVSGKSRLEIQPHRPHGPKCLQRCASRYGRQSNENTTNLSRPRHWIRFLQRDNLDVEVLIKMLADIGPSSCLRKLPQDMKLLSQPLDLYRGRISVRDVNNPGAKPEYIVDNLKAIPQRYQRAEKTGLKVTNPVPRLYYTTRRSRNRRSSPLTGPPLPPRPTP